MDALYTSDEAKRRFEIMARQVFMRFKALLMEPSAFRYAERHASRPQNHVGSRVSAAPILRVYRQPCIDNLRTELD